MTLTSEDSENSLTTNEEYEISQDDILNQQQ